MSTSSISLEHFVPHLAEHFPLLLPGEMAMVLNHIAKEEPASQRSRKHSQRSTRFAPIWELAAEHVETMAPLAESLEVLATIANAYATVGKDVGVGCDGVMRVLGEEVKRRLGKVATMVKKFCGFDLFSPMNDWEVGARDVRSAMRTSVVHNLVSHSVNIPQKTDRLSFSL